MAIDCTLALVTDAPLPPPLPPPVSIPLTTLPSRPCSYLPGRTATDRAFRIDRLPGEVYQQFMDAGFRRSGTMIYQPVCADCRECVPIRIPVSLFKPNKSQRRCIRVNADLSVSVAVPEITEEKIELYRRYITEWHEQADNDSDIAASLGSFLYESPVDTLEFCYRTPDGALVGVGMVDVCRQSLSSVYFFFDPRQSNRGLGTFGALYELEWARKAGIPLYYLGFWVSGCRKMRYKSSLYPSEILYSDGIWKSQKDITDIDDI